MKFLFFFFFLFFILPLALAPGFSPTSLIYTLPTGSEECQTVTIESDSETIAVVDTWAADKDVAWNIDLFTTESSAHGLTLRYDTSLTKNERSVDVCLKGEKTGEYHGVLLLREAQEGNSVVQLGIWLKATIGDVPTSSSSSPTSGSASSGSGSGSASGNAAAPVNTLAAQKNSEETMLAEKNMIEETGAPITGNVVGSGGDLRENRVLWISVFTIALVLIIGTIFMRRRNNGGFDHEFSI